MNSKNLTFKLLLIPVLISAFTSCNNSDPKAQACLTERAQLEANKKMVTEFYQALFGDKDISVVDTHIAEDYIQHNPSVADGRAALKEALTIWFTDAPKTTVDFQKVAADGDLVFLHIRTKFGVKTFSVIDIFRVKDGMITEHWDVMQEVPEKAENAHPMF
jgi:predicted SnoaL-like aldol condensation-catalyzing enzyme